MSSPDVIIVGAGIVGSALAHALLTLPKPLQIGLVERSLSEPDRIIGELLQPGQEWTALCLVRAEQRLTYQ